MKRPQRIDTEKGIEVLLYLSHKLAKRDDILRAVWAADTLHLEAWGRLIYDETYIAADKNHPPIPMWASTAIDNLPSRWWDSDQMSVSDGHALDAAVNDLSAGAFIEDVPIGTEIPIERFVMSVPSGKLVWEYMCE